MEPHRIARVHRTDGERFARRVLTEIEWPGYVRTVKPDLFLANRFAAKEAFSKAMGTGFRYPVTLQSISVVQNRAGQAGLPFHPNLECLVTHRGIVGHHLTISDDKIARLALAVALVTSGGADT